MNSRACFPLLTILLTSVFQTQSAIAVDTLKEFHETENHVDVAESLYRLGLMEFDEGNNDAAKTVSSPRRTSST